MSSYYSQHIALVILFGALAVLVNWIATCKIFYRLPVFVNEIRLSFMQVLGAFVIYIGTAFFFPRYLISCLRFFFLDPLEKVPSSFYGGAQILSVFCCFFFSGCFL